MAGSCNGRLSCSSPAGLQTAPNQDRVDQVARELRKLNGVTGDAAAAWLDAASALVDWLSGSTFSSGRYSQVEKILEFTSVDNDNAEFVVDP